MLTKLLLLFLFIAEIHSFCPEQCLCERLEAKCIDTDLKVISSNFFCNANNIFVL